MAPTQRPIETTKSEATELINQPGASLWQSTAATRNQSPVRQCAATRDELPISELIRFVIGPDDKIYPDLGNKLPGRGVWVTADRLIVEKAIKTGAFSRSLKRKVNIPDDLAQTVEQLMEKRVIGALSLANKAGNVVSGFDKVSALIERGRAIALVHASDGAAGGTEKLDRQARSKGRAEEEAGRIGTGILETIFTDCLTIEQMSLAIGRSNVVHAGLGNGGAAVRFVAEARRLVNYRKGVAIRPPP